MVFGVANLDERVASVESARGKKPFILESAPAPVYEKFDIAREAVVGSLAGGQIVAWRVSSQIKQLGSS